MPRIISIIIGAIIAVGTLASCGTTAAQQPAPPVSYNVVTSKALDYDEKTVEKCTTKNGKRTCKKVKEKRFDDYELVITRPDGTTFEVEVDKTTYDQTFVGARYDGNEPNSAD